MPATFIPPLDELAAVNELLTSIGQSPVSTLASSAAVGDVLLAQSFIQSMVRQVQLHGFAFNTDEEYPLTPDIDGYLKVPTGVLRITPSQPTTAIIQRRHPDGFWAMWEQTDRTWVFEEPEDFTVVWAYVFDDLPATARHFVTLSAARKFQMKIVGANSLDGFGAEDEAKAWATMQRDERATRKTNLFRRNSTMAQRTNSRRY